ncbi:MAG: 3'-5' exonuclease, partial [Nocardioides sp.]
PGDEPVEPLRLRAVSRDGRPLVRGLIPMRSARDYIAKDVAADIAGLLTSGTTFEGRPVEARDVAVLVEVREHGQLVADRLAKLGIPAVLAGGGQVFQTRAAEELATVLRAIERPQRAPLVRAAALTSFFGATPLDLVNRSEEITDKVADTLRGWGLLLRTRGVAAVMEAADEAGLVARVLGEVGGERHLTDLRHLTELLHQVALRERTGLPGLIDWLEEERRADAGDKIRRLDSDAAAVQIVTIHGSKGLQYPVVYVPFVFSRWVKDVEIALFHDADGRRFLDVSGRGLDWSDHRNAHLAEESGESLRKLYVAITRAQSQVVTWWAPTMNTEMGPLHRMMFGRQPGWGEVLERAPVKEDPDALMVLRAWETAGGPVVEEAAHASVDPLPRSAPSTLLARRRFERSIDDDWRRTSYSGLLRVDPVTPGVVSEPEVEALQDEPDPEADALPGEEGATGLPVALRGEEGGPPDAAPVVSPMTDLPAGAAFGSLVHGVLEVADPMAPDLLSALTAAAAEQLRWWPVEATADELAAGLLPSQLTPLGPIAAGLSLSEIPLSDRLCELDFEFPLAGGEDAPASGFPTLRDLAGVLRAHLADDDILAAYPDHLERPPLGDQPLKGYLSGSIDVVLRVRDDAGEPRFVVVDYKTNVLGDALDLALPMRASDYGRAAMAAAMIHSHYPLQALLYAVVLHRFLRWRLPGYDPQVHLGGVAYLFLRGMCGAETPADGGHPTGVFAWQPGADLVVALSDLLAGNLGGVRDE